MTADESLALLLECQQDPTLVHHPAKAQRVQVALAGYDQWHHPLAIQWGITDRTRPFANIANLSARQWLFDLITSQFGHSPTFTWANSATLFMLF
jgi:hypothetical protein